MEPRTSPWDLVAVAAGRAGVAVLPLDGLDDADRVRAVIHDVWGEQVLPREMVRAFQHAGTVLYGASAGDELVGFVLGFFGFDEGLHLHSHMLGVLPEWQARGVGYALKLAQRAACLDRGIHEVRWTYDPLLARNARFNLVKLGAVAFRFLPEFYGEMTDRLNRGDRSDRFEVRWDLLSGRVERALGGDRDEPQATSAVLIANAEDSGEGDAPEPRLTGSLPEPGCTVAVPRDHLSLRRNDPVLAARWRDASRQAFEACFRCGLIATWFTPDGEYLFEASGAA